MRWGPSPFGDDDPIPEIIDAESVDEVVSSHCLEHIPPGSPRIEVFNEVWRLLRPGGTFTFIVPLVGTEDGPVGTWHAWADPTHVSYWWFPESVHYFTGQVDAAAEYHIARWEPVRSVVEEVATRLISAQRFAPPAGNVTEGFVSVRDGWEGVCRLRKPT